MTAGLFDLPWLVPAPADFKARARAALASTSLDHVEVRKLAGYALDLSGLDTMGKVVIKHRTELIEKAGYTPIRLGIASSHTMHYVAAALPGTALRHHLVLDVVLSGLGNKPREIVSSESELGREALDAILIALDYRVLGLAEAQLSPIEAEGAVRRAIDYVAESAAWIRGTGTICILQTLVPPANSLFGNLESRVPGSVRAMVERFNEILVRELAQESDLIVDAAFLASAVGLSAWNYARDWNQARLPGALESTALYADHICRVLGAARGRTRKCLVMDLDGMLWGGTIGNDGLEGIRLGQGTSVGEAHVALQRYVLDLRRRGVLLAVCSQSAEANARLPFRAHPEMILREDHIAVFFANRNDKAGNIREIASLLNINTDAVVLLDHNPAQRAMVRDVLPEVAVPELTSDPADYAVLLSTAGYFEAARFVAEDLQPPVSSRENERPVEVQQADEEPRLESLEMVATISPFNAAGRERVMHLLNANQFNVTDKRFSSEEIEELSLSQSSCCIQISLADRRGDKGMVSVVVFQRCTDEWQCHIWLIKTAALGSRVDELGLDVIAQAAAASGASRLVAVCPPIATNAQVSAHFARLGFIRSDDLPGGKAIWTLDLITYEAPLLPFTIVRPN